ncbi:DUF4382 domain-containing protein [Mesoterricola silvestris]|uniref:DUF4382 domain-containing protein n=1 Tax=Mesoterricola silvestris TaxID=2927979 RepID=A0AA48GPI6_9BACT|nr:DUF4382 domain-containing protein [Mesoterricola silvestris]BDU73739.1 hypothetical protein METEAL_29130 [Mesoterricola silvestris]
MSGIPKLALPTCAALAFLLGCGGSSTSSAPTGTLTLTLSSDNLPGFSQVVVSLDKVEGTQDGSRWLNLGSPQTTVDLMALQNGHGVVILNAAKVYSGTYTQFRLTWGTKNYNSAINLPAYVIPEGGAGQVLAMPTTTVVKGSATLPSNGSAQALIMLSGDQGVLTAPASATPYRFNATGQAFDATNCGRITGQVAGPNGKLAGVEVLAQTVDGVGLATLARRAVSDASGAFELDGLPSGAIYYLAAQPLNCQAQAAAPGTLAAGATLNANLTFTAPVTSGTLVLAITPKSSDTQGTWGELRQSLATGAGAQNLIIRSRTAIIGASQDTVSFLSVAPGTYGVTAQRSTSGAAPVPNNGSQQAVAAGGTTNATLAF